MDTYVSNLRPDGTTFPPVTPDPPLPPGYEEPTVPDPAVAAPAEPVPEPAAAPAGEPAPRKQEPPD